VGMSIEGTWRDDDAFALVRRTAPYAALARAEFDAVLGYLAETSEALEERRVYAKVLRTGSGVGVPGSGFGVPGSGGDDGGPASFTARSRSVATIFYQNVGTIAGGASVRVKPKGSATPIGTVEEDFLENIKPGDRFLLGGRTWRFMFAQGMTAFVAPATGRPSVPRWASEILPASRGVARGVGALRARMAVLLRERGEDGLARTLARSLGIEAGDARAVARYVAAQEALSPIPATGELLVERWADPDEPKVLIHCVTSPVGRRANEALARVVAWRAGRSNAGLMVDDQAFALRLPARAAWTVEDLPRLFDPAGLADDVRAAVARSDLWGRRFRQVAATGLMLVKNYMGRSRFVGGMQHNARRIWQVLERERPDFPLVRETYRTVLEDDLDVPGAARWLARVAGHRTLRDLPAAPPFAFRLLAAGTTDSMLLEERDAFLRRLWEEAQEQGGGGGVG
jgi:ATP-dependent Lhr-like helicase